MQFQYTHIDKDKEILTASLRVSHLSSGRDSRVPENSTKDRMKVTACLFSESLVAGTPFTLIADLPSFGSST